MSIVDKILYASTNVNYPQAASDIFQNFDTTREHGFTGHRCPRCNGSLYKVTDIKRRKTVVSEKCLSCGREW